MASLVARGRDEAMEHIFGPKRQRSDEARWEHISVAAGGPKRKQGWEGRRGQDGRTDIIGGVGRANIDGRGWIGRTQMAGGGKYISKFYQLSEPLAVIRVGTLLHCGRQFGSAILRFSSKVKYQSGACPLL